MMKEQKDRAAEQGIAVPREDAGKKSENLNGKDIYDIFQIFFQSIIIITLLFIFVFRFSLVNGSSMLQTLHDKDWLILSNLGFTPERGKIVVVSQPNDLEEVLIKRIIALPGETIDITEDGRVTIDGQILEEPYVAERIVERGNVAFPHTVPDGCVFVMGDNRNHSSDSRSRGIGDIDIRYIVGEAKFRLFPFGDNWVGKEVDYHLVQSDDAGSQSGETNE